MKFQIEKSRLLNNIQKIKTIGLESSSLPISSNVRLEITKTKVKLTTINSNIVMWTTFKVDNSDGVGEIKVPAKTFFELVKKLPKTKIIDFNIDKQVLTIKAGKVNQKIKGFDGEFPTTDKLPSPDTLSLDQKTLKEMINLTDFAMAIDDSRPILNGALIKVITDKVSIIATDGRRLAMVERTLDEVTEWNKDFIVSGQAIRELKSVLSEEGKVTIKIVGHIDSKANAIFIAKAVNHYA
ncbi:hypothetical protein LCGC14_2462800, partial [marine sediment metagenome]